MATTGELRAIIEELHLVDIGDAASYLGEEAMGTEESFVSAQAVVLPVNFTVDQSAVTESYT